MKNTCIDVSEIIKTEKENNDTDSPALNQEVKNKGFPKKELEQNKILYENRLFKKREA